MTQTRRRKFMRGRVRILLAAFALLALVLGPAAVNGTLAGWTDSKLSQGAFTAGSVGEVQNLKCIDSKDGLIPNLLRTQVVLEWDPPAGIDKDLVTYEVDWRQTGLLGGSGTEYRDTTSYTYTASSLSLITLSTQFEVRAKLKSGEWIGPDSSTSAVSVGLVVLSVYMDCR